MSNKCFGIAVCTALSLMSGKVMAHPGLAEAGSFGFGFQHPFMGLDHFLVMSGLGLWLSRQGLVCGSRGIAVFLGSMMAGAALAMSGLHFAYVEMVIVVSVLLTGLLLLTTVRQLPGASGLSLIALVAFMHGQAHGSEMPITGSFGAYVFGFVLATLTLQTAGLVCGRMLQCYRLEGVSRVYGGLAGLSGICLLLGV